MIFFFVVRWFDRVHGVSLLREMVERNRWDCLSASNFMVSGVSNWLGNWLAVGSMFTVWVIVVPAVAATWWPATATAAVQIECKKITLIRFFRQFFFGLLPLCWDAIAIKNKCKNLNVVQLTCCRQWFLQRCCHHGCCRRRLRVHQVRRQDRHQVRRQVHRQHRDPSWTISIQYQTRHRRQQVR